jgi:RimJ/RimL family protein N-acetyltransferase
MKANPRSIKLKSNLQVTIRSLEAVDAAVFLDHLRKFIREAYRNMNHAATHFDDITVEQEAAVLGAAIVNPAKLLLGVFLTNDLGSQPIGQLGIFGNPDVFHKHNATLGMGIQKQFHGQGIGKALLDYGLEIAAENGFRRIQLNVRAFNESAITLYEKVGFEKVGTLKRTAFIDGEYFDEHMYEKHI